MQRRLFQILSIELALGLYQALSSVNKTDMQESYHFLYPFYSSWIFPGPSRAQKKYQSTPRSFANRVACCLFFLLLMISWPFFRVMSNTSSFANPAIVLELQLDPFPSEDIQQAKFEVALVGSNTNPYFLNYAMVIMPIAIFGLSLSIFILTLWFSVVIGSFSKQRFIELLGTCSMVSPSKTIPAGYNTFTELVMPILADSSMQKLIVALICWITADYKATSLSGFGQEGRSGIFVYLVIIGPMSGWLGVDRIQQMFWNPLFMVSSSKILYFATLYRLTIQVSRFLNFQDMFVTVSCRVASIQFFFSSISFSFYLTSVLSSLKVAQSELIYNLRGWVLCWACSSVLQMEQISRRSQQESSRQTILRGSSLCMLPFLHLAQVILYSLFLCSFCMLKLQIYNTQALKYSWNTCSDFDNIVYHQSPVGQFILLVKLACSRSHDHSKLQTPNRGENVL